MYIFFVKNEHQLLYHQKKREIYFKLAVDCYQLKNQITSQKQGSKPSCIYSCSISHILEHEFFCLGHFGNPVRKKNEVFIATFVGFFSTFNGQKNSNSFKKYCSVRTKKYVCYETFCFNFFCSK